MAKVSFTKLGLTKPQIFAELCINEQVIEVKGYLPVNEKLELISEIVSGAADENNFYNAPKGHVYFILGIVKYYTNITFTEKQLENPQKLYDLIVGNELDALILNAIPFCSL